MSTALVPAGRARLVVIPLMLPAVAALAAGVWAGLSRLGIALPGAAEATALNHGALMVGGFVGTVIAIERAVSARSRLALAVPALSAAGAISLLLRAPDPLPALLFSGAAAGLLALFGVFLRRQPGYPLALMAAGALCWLGANLVWLLYGWMPLAVTAWWYAFLALTIAGERLELARFRPRRRPMLALLGAAVASIVAGAAMGQGIGAGDRLLGAGLLALAIWLVMEDTARRTVRRGGVASYAAVALLAAYAWLAVTGVFLLRGGFTGLHGGYDSVLHAFFLGFVFGAIAAHAPIIFPAVAGVALRFTALFYVALGLLHGSVALRLIANAADLYDVRRWAAAGNAVALLALVLAVAVGVALGRRDAATQRRSRSGAASRSARPVRG